VIPLTRVRAASGEIVIARRRQDGAVGYWKRGHLQTLVRADGENEADFIATAVRLISAGQPSRALVLGFGGGVASTLLDRQGIEVVSIDSDACARGLATRFFKAPLHLKVITADAMAFLHTIPSGSFNAALVDLQDSKVVPPAYTSPQFWSALVHALTPDAQIVLNATAWLWRSELWEACQFALGEAGLIIRDLSQPMLWENRLLTTKTPRATL
jgi:spermidine synthase